jgi:hypothetical protein
LIGITKDPATRSIWAYSEQAVFKYKVTKEDRNVWQVRRAGVNNLEMKFRK